MENGPRAHFSEQCPEKTNKRRPNSKSNDEQWRKNDQENNSKNNFIKMNLFNLFAFSIINILKLG